MFNFNFDQKTVYAAGVVIVALYLFQKHEVKKAVESASEYLSTGELGESAYDSTHDPITNEPGGIGRILDWFAGIEYGVDY